MRRAAATIVVAAVLVGAAAATTLPALAADGPVVTHPQKVILGFYRGRTISYLDFGPVKLAPGNRVAPIWSVTNGAVGQVNVIDTVPGRASYTPLWDVRLVTWKPGVTPRVLMSATAVRRAVAAGQASVRRPGVVVNCPVL
jgi:hypothetical protein